MPVDSVGPVTNGRAARAPAIGAVRRVLVSYESSARGRAALFHALGLAQRAGAPLTVVTVATKEPVVGCARCRQSTVIWNREMRLLAEEELAEARSLVGPAAGIDSAVAVGDPVKALGEAADRSGADVVVLPWEPGGRLRRLFSPAVAGRLRKAGRWEVIVAPAAAHRSRDGSPVGVRASAAGSDQV